MICSRIAQASAALLAVCGLALLFASDNILTGLIPEFPVTAAWLGQLLGAALLAIAALNWLGKGMLVGGIYARHVTMANASLYFITAMVLLKQVKEVRTSLSLMILLILVIAFAGLYSWLLFRGPFESDFHIYQGKPKT